MAPIKIGNDIEVVITAGFTVYRVGHYSRFCCIARWELYRGDHYSKLTVHSDCPIKITEFKIYRLNFIDDRARMIKTVYLSYDCPVMF